MSRAVVMKEDPEVSKEVTVPPETQEDILYLAQRDMLDEETLAELDEDKLAAALNGEEVDDLSKEEPEEPAEGEEANPQNEVQDEYTGMNVDELRAELSARGLAVSGVKAELQQRLRDNDAANA